MILYSLSHMEHDERTRRRGEQRGPQTRPYYGRPNPDAFQEQDVCLSSLNEGLGANVGRGRGARAAGDLVRQG